MQAMDIQATRCLDGAFPLSNRVWVEIGQSSGCDTVMDQIDRHLASISSPMQLETRLLMTDSSPEARATLLGILPRVYRLRTGLERRAPRVFIESAIDHLDRPLLESVNEHDRHRPGIRIIATITESQLEPHAPIAELRERAAPVVRLLRTCHELALDAVTCFLLERDSDLLDSLLELRRITYTLDTSLPMRWPILQIAPTVSAPEISDLVDPLIAYVGEGESALATLEARCGLITLLIRASESLGLPATQVPLLSCGAGQSEITLRADRPCTCCLYSARESIPLTVLAPCTTCPHLGLCTGCIVALDSQAEPCSYRPILDHAVPRLELISAARDSAGPGPHGAGA